MTRLLFRRFVVLAFMPLLGFALAGSAFAQNPSNRASNDALLLFAEGKVEVAKAGGSAWNPGQTNQVLKVGDRLRTGAFSRATVRLSNLSLLRVDELTTLEIEPPQAEVRNPILNLKNGATYFFNRDKPLETQFRTPAASGAIRGTEFNLAVKEDGTTTLSLIDGQVSMGNAQGETDLKTGEQAVVAPKQAPQKTALIDAVNVIQWTLYYPAVLDSSDLQLDINTSQALTASLQAYQAGDLVTALKNYPPERPPQSQAETVYRAALVLASGQVKTAQSLLSDTITEPRAAALAKALRKMIAAVKGQSLDGLTGEKNLSFATEWMAESYYQQSQSKLDKALEAARKAVTISPNFGFALERVAELEFSFGHTKEARAALDKSLALAPRNAQALALKGFVLSAQNKITKATDYFEQAIALDPALANAWLGRGLVQIKQNKVDAGRKDLEVAAALEPNRAVLRSYLGKAWSLNQPFHYTWNDKLAQKELTLAKRLDPEDPTSWLYSALLNQQRNEVNQAIADLEKSQDLNNNRSVFRSSLLLDKDRAVRSANLASIYRDAGLTDVSVREATKAVNADYANYSAHLFLAESYDTLRDPRKRNLRYESPWLNELLLADLLAPVGAGAFSQNISQQEYSRLFESDRLGVSSRTDYLSTGDWVERGSQFGTYRNLAYTFDAYYRSENGFRPNADLSDLSLSFKVKLQVAPEDTVFFQYQYTELEAGDVSQYYDQSRANYDVRVKEKQNPNLIAGYHHEWTPGSHTLFLLRRLDDTFELRDPTASVLFFKQTAGQTTLVRPETFSERLRSDMEAWSTELQHILQGSCQALILGGRYQTGDIETTNSLFRPFTDYSGQPTFENDLWRASLYSYYILSPIEELRLTAGVSYDRLHYPENIDLPPISDNEMDKEKVSPKIGLEYNPWDKARLRGAYTRSLGGVFNDANTRIEPSQVAGFNQVFRSLIPESVVGIVPGSEFETWNVGFDQEFPTRTYFDIEGEWLGSEGTRGMGVVTNEGVIIALPNAPSLTSESLDFRERSLFVSLHQLIGQEWAVGARYRLSESDLNSRFPGIPSTATVPVVIDRDQNSVLHQMTLYANYNMANGFFSQFQSIWSLQSNQGFTPAEPGDEFWQFNLFAGYRFPRRHAEIRLGLLNIFDTDYQLEPLSFYQELPRDRTFAASFRFDF